MSLNLSLYRKLNVKKLGKECIEYLIKAEGSAEMVDNDKPRDIEWTQEIMGATLGYVIADAEGDILAEFDDLEKAEKALKGATIKFEIELEKD